MTVLDNAAFIRAPAESVWNVLGALNLLDRYDPSIAKSEVISQQTTGVGACRRCDLVPGGWFSERVTVWRPARELEFELTACSLPVRRLKHHYTLTPKDGGTLVQQRMEYQLTLGPIGALMDALFVRRKWDAGVKSFFAGLERYVERSRST